jgi:hypothetical protein
MPIPEDLTEEERALYADTLAELVANNPASGDPEEQAREYGRRALAAVHAMREQVRKATE